MLELSGLHGCAFDAGFERIAQEALDMNKVIIVGKIGNGQCIVTAILQRSFDPKSGHLMELKIERRKCKRGGKQSCIKVTNAQRFVSGLRQGYHIMAVCFSAVELQIIVRSRNFSNI
ncbi:hypothetical protein CMV_000844 [Castanea mollissima]|uniref:Uncharacterized protein n=1 Tax=Castanea mollissima TaxID=60419 RepID=A0A8J4RWI6_9ROSI|nr:hypothetical protein CMV_000844 [Castanea mollissima]